MNEESWSQLQIRQLGTVVTGRTPSSTRPDHFGQQVPFLTPTDITGSRRIERPSRYLSAEGARALQKIVVSNAVAVSCIGWQLGKVILVDEPSVTNQQINSVVVDSMVVDRLFLYYTLLLKRDELFRLASGGSRTPIVSKSVFESILIDVPPRSTQEAVVSVLSAIDDKIELNRRMNQTLEAMARAIFKSWFVDFEPVWEGRSLCSGTFQDSSLGLIPVEWRASIFGEHFAVTMGQSPPGETYNEEGLGVPFYQGSADFGFRFPSRRVFCSAPTRYANAGDTLLSVRAPVGAQNMAIERCAIGRGLAAMRHLAGGRSFTYYAMQSLASVFAKYNSEGTVFGSIGKEAVKSIPFAEPHRDMVALFERTVHPLDELILKRIEESHILTVIRDALLPKLLSGEIRVKQAEKIIGEVV